LCGCIHNQRQFLECSPKQAIICRQAQNGLHFPVKQSTGGKMKQIKQLLILGILAALATTLLASRWHTGQAAGETTHGNAPSKQIGLPNFDIRQPREGVSAPVRVEQSRLDAVEAYRRRIDADVQGSLKVEFNEAGVPKMFFNYRAPLSEGRAGTPDAVTRGFLNENSALFGLSARDVKNLRLDNVDNDLGTTFLNYTQRIKGVPVFQGLVQAAVRPTGEIMNINEGWVITGQDVDLTPGMTEAAGIAKAFEYAGVNGVVLSDAPERAKAGERATYKNPLGKGEDVMSDLRIMLVNGEARLAWHSFVDVGSSQWYEILVDARTGELLFRYNLYADAQGTVYTRSPNFARTLESFNGNATINPNGWLGTSTVTTGNNVDAYLDTDANNSPDNNNTTGLSAGRASSASQDFTFPYTTGVDPRTQKPAVVSNLFYFNNVMHDFVYDLGFTESAGNFQTNNFGRGGTGNDSVQAEAQDGSGTNNANFATPPEGSRPRMQQYLFTQSTTSLADDRDSSLDGDVVLHEYGHGVSNRLVGGPANTSCLGGTQSGAMGEGWSDYWAITFYNDGAMGEYVVNNTVGIRRAAYSVPANTVHDSYADVGSGGFQVHRDGEVWAATLFDLRQTLGASLANRLVLNGMKFTPCSPSMLNARDGILQADSNLNGGANACTIWTVFARHGMGFSAVGNDGTTHTAATNLPASCTPGTPTIGVSPASLSFTATAGGANPASQNVNISNTGGGALNWTASDNASWLTLSPTSGAAPSATTASVNITGLAAGTYNGTITVTATGATNSPVSVPVTLTVTTGGGGGQLITNGGFETGTTPWILSGAVRSTGAYPRAGTAYSILGGGNNQTHTEYQTITIPAGGSPNLTFWLNVTSSETTTTTQYDRVFVEVRNTSGTLLTTLATFSNLNKGTAGVYTQRGPYSLAAYAGQTVRIQFRATTDSSLATSFRVDDVSAQ
jgi:Zn-dependent metalloprotease